MPKKIVAMIRAQFLPARLAKAIHSHRPTPMSPTKTIDAMETFTTLSMSMVAASDRSRTRSRIISRMVSICASAEMMPTACKAAPAIIM
jgi:hypothetical protein